MFFWNSLAFSMIQRMLAIWSLAPLPLLNPAWSSGSSRFTYCWSLAWRILSITLLACDMNAHLWQFEHSLTLLFFGIGMKTDLFQSYSHCRIFQICWHMECSTFTASSFRIWNSPAGVPSPPLALFMVILLKAYLTSHSKMSSSRWVITLSLLSVLCFLFFIILLKISLLCILSTFSWYFLLRLGPYSFCPLLCHSLHEMFPWDLQFSWTDL